MELERKERDFERRLEETGGEICERLEQIHQDCKEAEEARRRDWEELNGRLMTAEEKHQFEMDNIRLLFARMTDEYVNVMRAASADIKREFAEGREEARAEAEENRAENRAQREALLKMLDRLPPN
jgi:coproporphyrinogen III oxidase